jgi:hypothetical protein
MGSPSDLGWLSEVEPSVRMELHPLDGGAMSELLTESARRLFGLEGEHLRRLAPSFVDRAQGNPFYLEQLLNVCNERGIDPTDWLQVAAAALPEGLHRLALARPRRSLPGRADDARVASATGERFAEPWLARCSSTSGRPTPSEAGCTVSG